MARHHGRHAVVRSCRRCGSMTRQRADQGTIRVTMQVCGLGGERAMIGADRNAVHRATQSRPKRIRSRSSRSRSSGLGGSLRIQCHTGKDRAAHCTAARQLDRPPTHARDRRAPPGPPTGAGAAMLRPAPGGKRHDDIDKVRATTSATGRAPAGAASGGHDRHWHGRRSRRSARQLATPRRPSRSRKDGDDAGASASGGARLGVFPKCPPGHPLGNSHRRPGRRLAVPLRAGR